MAVRDRALPAAQLAAVVALSAVAVVVLHRLGDRPGAQVAWSDVAGWLATAAPEDALVAALRLAALALAWWVGVSSLLYVAARALRLPKAVRAVAWATLPPVRRLADRAVAATLVGSSVLGGPAQAWAADRELPVPPPQVVQAEEAGEDDPDSQAGRWYVPTPAGSEPDAEGATQPSAADEAAGGAAGVVDGWQRAAGQPADRPADEPEEPGGTGAGSAGPPGGQDVVGAGESGHTVAAGEHLWGIAAARLAAVWGREPTVAETAAYWRKVVAVNTGRLASGDADLIYPGEELALPEAPARPDREE